MSAPQVIPNGQGYVVHKIRVPFLQKTYSAWLNASLEMEDCEGRDAKGRTRTIAKENQHGTGSAEWSAVKVAARLIVQAKTAKA